MSFPRRLNLSPNRIGDVADIWQSPTFLPSEPLARILPTCVLKSKMPAEEASSLGEGIEHGGKGDQRLGPSEWRRLGSIVCREPLVIEKDMSATEKAGCERGNLVIDW
jgi:hypothetical protein